MKEAFAYVHNADELISFDHLHVEPDPGVEGFLEGSKFARRPQQANIFQPVVGEFLVTERLRLAQPGHRLGQVLLLELPQPLPRHFRGPPEGIAFAAHLMLQTVG